MQQDPAAMTDDPSSDEAIKWRIKLAIESKNMKIKRFAREAGMAYPSLRDYHSGLRKPGFDAIAAILRFTGVSGDWLMLGKGPMFLDQPEKATTVDEALIGRIAQQVAYAYDMQRDDQIEVAEPDGLYSARRRELREELKRAGERAVLSANVYNRVAGLDETNREETIRREVAQLVRLQRGLNATRLEEEGGW